MRVTNRNRVIFLMIMMLGLVGCNSIPPENGFTEGALETVSQEKEEASRDIFAMDTYMTVTAYGTGAREAVDQAVEEIERLDALLSTGSESSEIGKINRNGGGDLSEDAAYLLTRSLELYQDTEGVFDIAIYPVMKAWGFADGNYRVPGEKELRELMSLTDVNNIEFSETEKKVSFAREGMEIDFGGIAKGYTSARIMDIYRACGIESGVVNLGGNVQVFGSKSDGSPWRVAVQDPRDSQGYLGIISVKDKAVITSGGYERYFEQDGVTYHHIIDPATGYPADSGLMSATVISADGTLADGLSTTLFIMGREQAISYWQERKELFDMILFTEEGTLYITEGIAESVTSEYPIEIVK